ncbi:MAG: hypothetical protein LBP28_05600 [Coriobacteriales bacterium]|jgi:hypothetical protein|nr:hypothetical protein [Coriobacteriales bacterium]
MSTVEDIVNIEALLVSYLSTHFNVEGVPVSTDVPAERPARFITLERTGGGRSARIIDSPAVAIQCWGVTRSDALFLANEVVWMLEKCEALSPVTSIEIDSMYNFPDLKGRHPRYQVVAHIVTAN